MFLTSKRVMINLLFGCGILLSVGRSDPAQKPTLKGDMNLGFLLFHAKERYGVHFTVESESADSDPSGGIVHFDSAPANLDNVLRVLQSPFRGGETYMVVKDATNDKVIHLVAKKLFEDKAYPLNATLPSVDFRGDLNTTFGRAEYGMQRVRRSNEIAFGLMFVFNERPVPIEVRGKQVGLRELLSDYLPVREYGPVLWKSNYSENGKTVTVLFSHTL